MSAKELKLWRKRWGITQVDLARVLGTYQVTIARWETEARKIPFLLPLALEALEHRFKKGDEEPDLFSCGTQSTGTRIVKSGR